MILFSRAIITSHCAYGEMSGHQSCKVTVFFFSEIPSHDFCCAYLERHNMIFWGGIIRDPF